MTTKEIYEAEQSNEEFIMLHRNGMFWRAYERSAFAVVQLVRDFKVMKKSVKSLEGKEVVFVGMPRETCRELFSEWKPVQAEEMLLKFPLKQKIDLASFERWKKDVPLMFDKEVPAGVVPPLAGSSPAVRPKRPASDECARRVAARLGELNLAAMTPVQCMVALADLQAHLFGGSPENRS